MKKLMLGLALVAMAGVWGETIDVPAGETRKVAPGTVFAGDALVKTGGGTLDLTGAQLKNAGLEIREGAVRFAGGGATTVTARYLKWNVTKTRIARRGPPDFSDSGSQFSEFRLYRDGKVLQFPKGATALNGNPAMPEGPQKGIDGNLKTKCYFNPLILDLGEEVTFDGYSFVTANDAIGRDPMAWRLEMGVPDGSTFYWVGIGVVADFDAPKERFTEAGKVFPAVRRDVVPFDYPVTIGGKGRLVLAGVHEMLERVRGNGLIVLEAASVEFAPTADFVGAVAGAGDVAFRK